MAKQQQITCNLQIAHCRLLAFASDSYNASAIVSDNGSASAGSHKVDQHGKHECAASSAHTLIRLTSERLLVFAFAPAVLHFIALSSTVGALS